MVIAFVGGGVDGEGVRSVALWVDKYLARVYTLSLKCFFLGGGGARNGRI